MSTTINLQAIDDSFIDSLQPNVNYGSSPVLLVGKLVNDILYRSLLKFDLGSIPSGASIISAELTLYMNLDYSGTGTIASITPYAVVDSWNGATVTWNNQPAINNSVAGTTTNVTVIGFYSFNVLNLVSAWFNGSLTNNGLELKTEETASLETKSFASSEAASQKPVLTIQYDTTVVPIDVNISGHAVTSGHEDVITEDSVQFTTARDISQNIKIGFMINNTSDNSAIVGIESSNNGITYAQEFTTPIFPNTVSLLESSSYSGFKRVSYQSLILGQPATLSIDYLAQS